MPEGPTIIDSEGWYKEGEPAEAVGGLVFILQQIDFRTKKARLRLEYPHDYLQRMAAAAGFKLVPVDSVAAQAQNTRVTT